MASRRDPQSGAERSRERMTGRRTAAELSEAARDYFSVDETELELARGLGKSGSGVETGTVKAAIQRHNALLSQRTVGLKVSHRDLGRRAPKGYSMVRVMQIPALLTSLLLFAVAIGVDFQIANEFWSQTFLDEFGREGVVSSGLKAMQVVFAVLAMHIVLRYGGRAARKLLAWVLLAILVPVVVGFGLLVSLESLPPGAEIFGIPVSERVATLAEELGGAAAEASEAENAVRSWETILRLGSLSLVFLLVTGVGAFALTYALNSARAMMGALQFDQESKGAERLPFLHYQYLFIDEVLGYLNSVSGRMELLQAYAADFVLAYRSGLVEKSGGFMGIGRGGGSAGADPETGALKGKDAELVDQLSEHIDSLFQDGGPFSAERIADILHRNEEVEDHRRGGPPFRAIDGGRAAPNDNRFPGEAAAEGTGGGRV